MDLGTIFGSSKVGKVYLSEGTIGQITQWVEESLQHMPVPEVGGLLLGRVGESTPDRYTLMVEQFVGAKEVNFNSPVLLDFGEQVLLEMDHIQDQHPDLINVGWFHTHPGHTPFLSGQDLSSHSGFFQKPFQVAIVLDSLTTGYDTGIFSQKESGEMNNKEDRTTWISWKTLLADSGEEYYV